MVTFVIDAPAAIALVRHGYDSHRDTELIAPTLLRSQVLARIHTESVSSPGSETAWLEFAERACRLPRRLLGDAVLRSTAWRIATEQGWEATYDAEYVALTKLHGEALITASDTLRARASGLVRVESVDDLLARR